MLVVPLGMMRLTDNMLIQFSSFWSVQIYELNLLVSFIATFVICFEWMAVFGKSGFHPGLMPPIGTNLSQVVGVVLFNYAFITTIPSWLNSKHDSVEIKKSVWTSLILATILYLLLGLIGKRG